MWKKNFGGALLDTFCVGQKKKKRISCFLPQVRLESVLWNFLLMTCTPPVHAAPASRWSVTVDRAISKRLWRSGKAFVFFFLPHHSPSG